MSRTVSFHGNAPGFTVLRTGHRQEAGREIDILPAEPELHPGDGHSDAGCEAAHSVSPDPASKPPAQADLAPPAPADASAGGVPATWRGDPGVPSSGVGISAPKRAGRLRRLMPPASFCRARSERRIRRSDGRVQS